MKHSVLIYYCEIDKIYVAKVPELRGCMAHGDTQKQALQELETAYNLWLEVAMEIPKPLTGEFAIKYNLLIN